MSAVQLWTGSSAQLRSAAQATNLYMGTVRYRSAVTPETTYSHQKKASGNTWQRIRTSVPPVSCTTQ